MNKKSIIISAVILINLFIFMGMIVGCSEIDTGISIKEPTVGEVSNETIYIWTDEETGVQYVVYSKKASYAGMGGITPRLNPDGSLYVIEK